MPFDKWGIPFWYPTKKTKGLTSNGPGFFWQQNNDFRKDNQSGMIRLGKEQEDCKLINSTTGEWEFPYLTDGDGLSISGSTGHHTGGESHGCQGFAYMCDSKLDVSPPRFRFRKETYHVQYDTHSSGEWTSPFATGSATNNWKGYGWVRYNKKNGRGSGKDSVILEVWWNDNPSADIKNWKMLKRIEDKGAGVTNWGVKATCDGDDYQVGTWSNIQFRFKSSASDFSLHPLIPEGEDDPVVHSIGDEGMSFSDSEGRGYGKRADMPRDIEMKCLMKWDAGGRGKCHFKNISLREIDPLLSFDDDPNPTPDPPSSTVRIIHYATAKGVANDYFQYTKTISEETVESCTDPDPHRRFGKKSFWAPATLNEIGDLCDGIFGEYASGLDVKAYWSNNDNNCVVPHINEVDLGGSTKISNPEGGPVLKNAKIYLVYWGTDWPARSSPPTMAGVTDKIQNKLLGTNVEYFTKLSQYGQVEAPTWGGAVSNTTFPVPSGSVNKTNVQQVLTDTFNKGLLSIPNEDDQNIYHVILPVGKTVVNDSAVLVGGFHDVYKTSIVTTAPPPPTSTSTITGTFRFNQDINTIRASQCAGVGAGGGGVGETGNTEFYTQDDRTSETELSNSTTFQNRTRGGEQCENSSSPMRGKTLNQLDVWLAKVGSPPSAPDTVDAKIWTSSGSVRYTSPTHIDPSTLSTTFTKKVFDFSASTVSINTGDVVGVSFNGTSDTNYVLFGYGDKTISNCVYVNWEGGAWEPKPTTRDFAAVMWE